MKRESFSVKPYARCSVFPSAPRDVLLQLMRCSAAAYSTNAGLLLAFLSAPCTVNQAILGRAIFSAGERTNSSLH
jgi:hypothetical protein